MAKTPIIIQGYHRTQFEENALFIGELGAGINKGIYGPGFYMARSLANQLRSNMASYGKYIVHCDVDITNYVCFDQTLAMQVWGKRHSLYRQLKAIKPDWKVEDLQYIKRQNKKLSDFWKRQQTKKSRSGKSYATSVDYSSNIAQSVCSYLKLNRYANGVVYTGSKDGDCVVAFKPVSVTPIRYSMPILKGLSKNYSVNEWHSFKDKIEQNFYLKPNRNKMSTYIANIIDTIDAKYTKVRDKVLAFQRFLDKYLPKKNITLRSIMFLEVWATKMNVTKWLHRVYPYIKDKFIDKPGILIPFGFKSIVAVHHIFPLYRKHSERMLNTLSSTDLPRVSSSIPLIDLPYKLKKLFKEIYHHYFTQNLIKKFELLKYLLAEGKNSDRILNELRYLLGVGELSRFNPSLVSCLYNDVRRIMQRNRKIGKHTLPGRVVTSLVSTSAVMRYVQTLIHVAWHLTKTAIKPIPKTWNQWWEKIGKTRPINEQFLQQLKSVQ